VRFLTLLLLALIFPCCAWAQTDGELVQRVEALEQRVASLEAQHRKLLGVMSVMHYIHEAKDGRRVAVTDGDQVIANLVIGQRDWGESRPEDVAAVAVSVAKTIFAAIAPQDTPTILILRSEHGPRALSNRGPNNEYIILLNTRDRLWAQLSYQLAHEFGHVLCRDLNEHAPQHWFEEAFCEAMSIWTLEKMAQSWKTDPPYDAWASYAESLAQYVADVRSKVQPPNDFGVWYAAHRRFLDGEPYDRDKNRIIASHIATQANARPDYLRAFQHLRATPPDSNTIESLFQVWHSSCENDLQFVPRDLANLLGVRDPGQTLLPNQ
jgi:hypothetical protein